MDTINLSQELNNIKIDTTASNIVVRGVTTESPKIIFNPDFFDVENQKTILVVKNKIQTPNTAFVNMGSCIINGVPLGNSGSVFYMNGTTIIQNGVSAVINDNNLDTKIQLFLNPETIYQLTADITSGKISIGNLKLSDLTIDTTSGDVSVSDIDALSVNIDSMSGDVSLINVDILSTLIDSMSGDVNMDVAESMINYLLETTSLSGHVRQTSTEAYPPSLSDTKRKIKIHQMSGNTHVNFKGKRQ